MARIVDVRVWMVLAAIAAVGCGSSNPSTDDDDAGITADDAGSGGGDCNVDMAGAAGAAGCNGWAGAANPNEPGGACTPGGDTMPRGTCTTEGAICMGDINGTGGGWCVVLCPAPENYTGADGCASGFRCFKQGEGVDAYGICFRDCNADHPCQEGWTCNTAENRCEETVGS